MREHSLAKVPVLLVVGKKEAAERTVSIRRLGSERQQVMPLDAALKALADEAMPPDVQARAESRGVTSTDLFSLDGKIALVTGAGSGLGREFALGLAGASAFVICADREKAWVDGNRVACPASGRKASRTRFDVADQGSSRRMVAAMTKFAWQARRAGQQCRRRALPQSRCTRATSTTGSACSTSISPAPFLCTRALLPLMLKAGGGSIINIASMIGLVGFYPDFSVSGVAYAASKAG